MKIVNGEDLEGYGLHETQIQVRPCTIGYRQVGYEAVLTVLDAGFGDVLPS